MFSRASATALHPFAIACNTPFRHFGTTSTSRGRKFSKLPKNPLAINAKALVRHSASVCNIRQQQRNMSGFEAIFTAGFLASSYGAYEGSQKVNKKLLTVGVIGMVYFATLLSMEKEEQAYLAKQESSKKGKKESYIPFR